MTEKYFGLSDSTAQWLEEHGAWSVFEAADSLGIPANTLYRWVQDGKVDRLVVSSAGGANRIFFLPKHVEAIREKQEPMEVTSGCGE